MLKAAKAYLATQVSTASQGDLLLMLYDTAIKHLTQAIEKMRAGDMAGKGMLITKAIAIISELQECLNKDKGGEISKNLFSLYFFCNTRLLTANLKVKPDMVEEVIAILSGLRQAFAQVLPTQDGVASLAQPGAGPGFVPAEAPSEPGAAEAAAAEPGAVAVGAAQNASGAEPAAAEVPAPEVAAAPVNPVRFRAANAYATTR